MYIRSGLTSLVNESEAVNLITKTAINIENNGNICLQKIISDSLNMIESFPIDDIQSDIGNSVIVHTNATYLYNTV